jgi:hypothetical protein
MVGLSLTLLLLGADPADEGLAKQMLPIYVKEASEYSITVESAPKKALELKKEPVFEWSNPVRAGVQQGLVFLWLREGRPAALGSIWSQPEGQFRARRVYHEFHALDPEKLLVSRPPTALNEWKPQAGLERKELSGAGAPAPSAGARLVQMRRLAQEFTGYETDNEDNKRWDLRLLPAPLYRYPEAKSGILDGALFTLVSNAGTDPEVLLLIEAKEVGGKRQWEYACGRFSDRSLYVRRNGKEVWTSIRNETNVHTHDPLHTYRAFPDKVVSPEGKLLGRIRVTDQNSYGDVIPVDDR